MWLGLAGSAILAAALSAAQLLPVIEFTQQTGRSNARLRTRSISTLSIHASWSSSSGPISWARPSAGTTTGAIVILTSGRTAERLWVPSLYLGGLTIALALGSLALRSRASLAHLADRDRRAQRAGKPGPVYQPDLADACPGRHAGLGDISQLAARPRPDGSGRFHDRSAPTVYLRDSDGSFYWWLSTVLPGFRQFRYPAKLFTFTALALAALAGLGWDQSWRGAIARDPGGLHLCSWF